MFQSGCIEHSSIKKRYASVIEVLLAHREDDIQHVVVNKEFKHGDELFCKHQILKICDEDYENISSIKVQKFPDKTTFSLPCYIEGDFTKYAVPYEANRQAIDSRECFSFKNIDGNSESSDEGIDLLSDSSGKTNGSVYHLPELDSPNSLNQGRLENILIKDNCSCTRHTSCIEEQEFQGQNNTNQVLSFAPVEIGYVPPTQVEMDKKCRKNYSTKALESVLEAKCTDDKNSPISRLFPTKLSTNPAHLIKRFDSETDITLFSDPNLNLPKIKTSSPVKMYSTYELCNLFKKLSLDNYIKHLQENNINGELFCSYSEKALCDNLKMDILEARVIFNYIHNQWRPNFTKSISKETKKNLPVEYTVQGVQNYLRDLYYIKFADYILKYQIDGQMLHYLFVDNSLIEFVPQGNHEKLFEKYEFRHLQQVFKKR